MTASLAFEPITARIGARAPGFALDPEMPDATLAQLLDGLLAHQVLVFEDQHHLTPAAQRALGLRLGRLAPRHPMYPIADGIEEVMVIINDPDTPPENEVWHSDLSCYETPPAAAILAARHVPPAGGDTMWCSMTGVLEDLSEPFRGFLETLSARHDFRTGFAFVNEYADLARRETLKNQGDAAPKASHPVVMRHPVSGQPLLYVNESFTDAIEGLSAAESRLLLNHLAETVRHPRNHMRLKWKPGMVAIWDNYLTQHMALGDHWPAYREMHRVTVAQIDARAAGAAPRAA
ncbi:MAG: TauD/TfdA family dioxygenase [Marivibrio sp.]|uniref:TauD/TfdA dioxygenase family protein n=1 Tax=Marivibrio sp. TaxID=2039719 RepID=UPI0032EA9198